MNTPLTTGRVEFAPLPPSTICEETCQTCNRDFNPSLVESGECIFCIAKAHRERAEKAEAACAEMRDVIKQSLTWVHLLDDGKTWTTMQKAKLAMEHALSSDCGKGWLSPQQAEWLNGEANRMEATAQRLREAFLRFITIVKDDYRVVDDPTGEIVSSILEATKALEETK